MKRLLMALLLATIAVGALAQANGEIRWFDDKQVVRVWGTHQERGYALGYLLGEETLELFNDYFLNYLMSGNPIYYAQVRGLFEQLFEVDADYVVEGQALLDGAVAGGQSLYNSALSRDLDVTDVLIVNAIVDLSAITLRFDPTYFGCATLSSWGEATQNAPTLGGELVMTRFMDWSSNQTLRDNPLIIVQQPSEDDEIGWASFTYPGLIGALSTVDETGRACMLNMGSSHALGTGSDAFHPQLLTLRAGVERFDSDGDGEHTLDDVVSAMQSHRRRPGTIVTLVVSPGEEEPRIVESNDAAGVSVRTLADNTAVPGVNLAATNHFRTLYPPMYCNRYNAIVDSLDIDPLMTLERNPKLLAGAAGGSNNLQSICFETATMTVGFATTTSDHYAYEGPYTVLTLDDLFGDWTSVDGEEAPHSGGVRLRAWPNPFNPSTTIEFAVAQPCHAEVRVYSIRGRRVAELFSGAVSAGTRRVSWDAAGLAGGVYLARVTAGDSEATTKVLLLE
ncbi:MAG: T9SS type A sorting domain-containing protein [Candidatus Cloacimonetes bacterium]|nr:T9SS type A sorting domain-containing protein [Candidatus Cloacimonadota bacterium]